MRPSRTRWSALEDGESTSAFTVILGLPGESREDMMLTAKRLGRMEFQGIKLHLLHILRDTAMARQYANGEISLLSLAEYVSLAVDFLEYLPPRVVIHRMTGDAPPTMLIAPEWCLNKTGALRAIEEEMRRRNFRQGSRRHPSE
jgi:radical SAM protein (TIGR01212 family)